MTVVEAAQSLDDDAPILVDDDELGILLGADPRRERVTGTRFRPRMATMSLMSSAFVRSVR